MHDNVLTPQDLATFEDQGFLPLRAAFAPADALAMQDFMWAQLHVSQGVERSNPATWSHYAGGLNKSGAAPVYRGIAAPRLCAAIDQLLGAGAWQVPKSWGGFLITFPEGALDTWELTRKNWHWDGKPGEHRHGLRGLFIFTLYSHIAPGGGGTLLAAGSHRLIQHFFETSRGDGTPIDMQHFRLAHPWLAELTGITARRKDRDARIDYFMRQTTVVEDIPLRIVEITGAPGDAFLCHPAIFHAASFNHSTVPRFMRTKGLPRRGDAFPQ